jgi:hypothetical protein
MVDCVMFGFFAEMTYDSACFARLLTLFYMTLILSSTDYSVIALIAGFDAINDVLLSFYALYLDF